MNIKYLAVDSNVQLANSEAVVWLQRGIEMERADNIREAIQKLSINDEYLYVGINVFNDKLKTRQKRHDFVAAQNL